MSIALFEVEPEFERFNVQPACFHCGARGPVMEADALFAPRAVVAFAELSIGRHMAFAHPELVEAVSRG